MEDAVERGICWQLVKTRTTPPEHSLPSCSQGSCACRWELTVTSVSLGWGCQRHTHETPGEAGTRPRDPHGPLRPPVFPGFTKQRDAVSTDICSGISTAGTKV